MLVMYMRFAVKKVEVYALVIEICHTDLIQSDTSSVMTSKISLQNVCRLQENVGIESNNDVRFSHRSRIIANAACLYERCV